MRRCFTSQLGKAALVALLQLSPALAFAALAAVDVAGTPRASPATMGAMEVATSASSAVNAPTGLVLTIQHLAS